MSFAILKSSAMGEKFLPRKVGCMNNSRKITSTLIPTSRQVRTLASPAKVMPYVLSDVGGQLPC